MEEDDGFGLSNISLIEDQIQEKENVIPIVDYSPKIDEKLWFMNNSNNSNNNNNSGGNSSNNSSNNNNNNNNNINNQSQLEKKKSERIKKNSIKNCQYRIDHYYYNKKYIECIEELNFLKTLVRLKKKQDYNDDIIDVEIRCNFKLNNHDNVIKLIRNVETTLAAKNIPQFKDQNLLNLLSQSYHFKELYNESIIEYHRLLTVNRRIWEWWFNLSLAYINKQLNIITKENINSFISISHSNSNENVHSDSNSNNIIINLDKLITIEEIKNQPLINRVLAFRSLNHSQFLLVQSLNSKKQFKDTKGYKQLESIKLVIEHLANILTLQQLEPQDSSLIVITEEFIGNSIQELKRLSNNNEFESKWFIEFKVENFKVDDDDLVEDREENPFTL